MNYDHFDHFTGQPDNHPGQFGKSGHGQNFAAAEAFPDPLAPPDPAWDPAEELADILQSAMESEHASTMPLFRHVSPVALGRSAEPMHKMAKDLPRLMAAPRRHRKLRVRSCLTGPLTISNLAAALVAVITSMVSVVGGMVNYEPLWLVAAAQAPGSTASLWPLLIYGPWLVASLSILRAALYQRRAVHSWAVVLLFSSVAVLLCILQAPRTIADAAATALPILASLTCLQQLVRQIALTRPPRQTTPRHRLRLSRKPLISANGRPVCVVADEIPPIR
ncbi:hypothetical protein AB0D34_36160 [Streptomyces sp. NPDC048420]|uniref:hypothetical protein n=1 Tax=Streptomyces sp. NPDC048420 TaxID=3155755 RepID=UPI00341A58E2